MKSKILNKILLLTVVISLLFTMTANAAAFTDISTHWAKSYIERVAAKGIVSGYDNGTFKPDNNVTVLEALVMISRLYDIDDDLKEKIVEEYEPSLKTMTNTLYNEWSFEYLSVIIELGVVSENGIEDMFAKKTIFQQATREEIAVLLTKAMMLGDEAQSLKVYTLPFADAAKISTSARPYVYVMYDKDIFEGDSNKNINPSNKITRAEIATLLDKAYKYIDENDVYPDFDDYEPTTSLSGIITEVSEGSAESYIYVKDDNEVESIVKINKDTDIYLNGKAKDIDDLKEDMLVKCKINSERIAVKLEADSSTDVVRGIIYYVAYVAPAKITIIDEDDDKITYDMPTDVKVYLDGKEIALKELDKNDEVTLYIDDDKVYQINSISRIKKYSGTITAIDYNYPIVVKMKTKEGVIKSFTFNSDVDVTRNDDDSNFDQVRVGDEVTITTEYDEMIAINTIAKEAEMSGTIKEIIIGDDNKIKIADEDGETTQYAVSNNVIITIGSSNATIYDLRVGYNVSVNTSGNEIVTIEAAQLQTAKSFSGKVIYINTDDKIIMMQNIKDNGQKELIYLTVTNNTKIFDTTGSTKYFKDLEEGENILSTAISQSGEYVAASIMIQ
ncbi:S-layer homology domain-containing protein [Sedimentibacter sp. B4]|uniref:S-layer homology domain-containing protein n=1 Tax=Sedimentibacter sp. B4 TaxID=304766 RepID=UPI0002EA71AC|nr:S-layer homology domain-containing protein [Sedimentibacter sp. B4]